jgi:hypothetical protein
MRRPRRSCDPSRGAGRGRPSRAQSRSASASSQSPVAARLISASEASHSASWRAGEETIGLGVESPAMPQGVLAWTSANPVRPTPPRCSPRSPPTRPSRRSTRPRPAALYGRAEHGIGGAPTNSPRTRSTRSATKAAWSCASSRRRTLTTGRSVVRCASTGSSPEPSSRRSSGRRSRRACSPASHSNLTNRHSTTSVTASEPAPSAECGRSGAWSPRRLGKRCTSRKITVQASRTTSSTRGSRRRG